MKITYDELLNELDKYRPLHGKKQMLTKEQIVFLKKCRNHARPISFDKIAMLWETLGWGKYDEKSIRARWAIAKDMK